MRKTAQRNGVSVKAYAGTTGVLLAMNVEPQRRAGLLGFALDRRGGGPGAPEGFLPNRLHFPGSSRKPGDLAESDESPIQRFRWSDYAVHPDAAYTYTAHPVYGSPAQPVLEDGPTITVTTHSLRAGEHRVVFNRAAAASQAFSRKFKSVAADIAAARKAKQPLPPLPAEALAWLARGLLDQLIDFIGQAADATWALDIAIYEYELDTIVKAVEAAHARGARVRVVYHARAGDPQTTENEHNLAGLPAANKRGRLTTRLCHHKFIVLSRLNGEVREPRAVLCGSTNFTENGVYRQANVVHIVERADIAGQYLSLFELLFRGDDSAATRTHISKHNVFGDPLPLFAGFSPRSKGADLAAFVAAVQGASRDVLFCTAFDLYDPLEDALLGLPHDPILRYGLQNSRSRITGIHADRTAAFPTAALLPAEQPLEGWLREGLAGQKGNILIHTKIVIVDFTSDAPIVISGSHNLSNAASVGNDENYLIFRGDTDIADCYGCELLRFYDHYRFRWSRREAATQGAIASRLTLATDDSWTAPFFGGDALRTTDRLRFVGL